MFQTKEQDKTSEENPNETEINYLPDKEFKAIVIKMLTELGKRINEYSENFNKEPENTNHQSELMNTVTEMKNTPEGINSRLGDTEECLSDLEDRIEITQTKQPKKNKF